MKKIYNTALIAVLIHLYFFSSSICFANTSKTNLTQQQLSELQQQIKQAQVQLEEINNSKNSNLQTLKKIDGKINQFIQQIERLKAKKTPLEKNLSRLQQEITSNHQLLSQHQAQLAMQLRSSYQLGQKATIKLILNQQNPAIFSRVMTYYEYINKARITLIQHIDQLNSQLIRQQSELDLLRQEIDLQEYLISNEKKQLEQQQINRLQELKLLANQKSRVTQDLKQLQKNEKAVQILLHDIQKVTKKVIIKIPKKPFNQLKRKLKWPLKGKLRKLYGKWRSLNKVKWSGNIIQAPEGRDVYSISHGTVVYSDWLRGYGLLTIIDHGKGYMSLYGYSQALLTSIGDQVAPGQVIAKAGRTSGRRKAGIYFEIRYKGKPSNPSKWCRKMPQ